MISTSKLAAAALAILMTTTGTATAQKGVEIGRLQCNVEGGIGFIIGSSKDAVCQFFSANTNKSTETYYGTVHKVGLDIGVTEQTTIQWLVFAAKSDAYSKGALAGQYVGLSAEATIGVGLGGNLLIGGSSKSFTLQPFSIQGQTGLNVAAGVTGFRLSAAN